MRQAAKHPAAVQPESRNREQVQAARTSALRRLVMIRVSETGRSAPGPKSGRGWRKPGEGCREMVSIHFDPELAGRRK